MKILVGLSGGVDSAVCAYLLKKQGHDVTCAFMRNWDSLANNDLLGNPTLNNDVCPQESDWIDAKNVADTLGLECLRVDFVKEYWDDVFSTFLKEYKRGRTPNPDILCNKYIKFKSFFEFAQKNGFEWVATGHYAKVVHEENESFMRKADDDNKDQSYFLCQVPKEALRHTLFPLGEIDKPEVRRISKELNLSIAAKKDSTGICFIGERNFREFLKNYLPSKEGNIINIDNNKVLGKHQGVLYYTIGQRKGLNIGGEGGPWFVVGKEVAANELFVASGEDNKWLKSTRCIVNEVNWLANHDFNELACQAKFRYRQKDNEITLRVIDENTVECFYPQGIKAVTPGQEAVFYKDGLVLGGGVIDQVFSGDEELSEKLIKQRSQG
ncbi:tRNA-specific 2-thiouridylase MnmA [bioreactor metagenome]|uniref:tRNA-specific 2-thiouridylase MnmA n=1 Tax=bioreactor metagenome TaxID=1076179 RepID=A0A645CUQ3_9ZZZZ